jgi:hypothetical protein
MCFCFTFYLLLVGALQASTLTALVLSQTFFTHRRKVANYKNRIPYAMERDNFVETYDRGYWWLHGGLCVCA